MKNMTLSGLMLLFCTTAAPAGDVTDGNPYGRWKKGPSSDPGFFPVAVWLQHASRAKRYQELGINLYIGLWKGPTEEQLGALKKARMKVICAQNEVGLKHKNDDIIVAWVHGDEPDNARWLGKGKGYGPPVKPGKILADYRKIKARDPTRPVILNLGQGVAWDGWRGRGVRTNHLEIPLRHQAATRLGARASVHHSIVSKGTRIEGEVIDSILSPGVYIAPGASVRHSILLPNVRVESDCVLDNVIVDKHSVIGRGARIGEGDLGDGHNNDFPHLLHSGTSVIGKNAHIPPGLRMGRNCLVFPNVRMAADPGTSVPAGKTFYLIDN